MRIFHIAVKKTKKVSIMTDEHETPEGDKK